MYWCFGSTCAGASKSRLIESSSFASGVPVSQPALSRDIVRLHVMLLLEMLRVYQLLQLCQFRSLHHQGAQGTRFLDDLLNPQHRSLIKGDAVMVSSSSNYQGHLAGKSFFHNYPNKRRSIFTPTAIPPAAQLSKLGVDAGAWHPQLRPAERQSGYYFGGQENFRAVSAIAWTMSSLGVCGVG